MKCLLATPAGLEATQVKVPESASCTWEILTPSSKGRDKSEGGERERGTQTPFSSIPSLTSHQPKGWDSETYT